VGKYDAILCRIVTAKDKLHLRTTPGRPREDQLDDAIHRATLRLLAEVGYAGMKMAGVARLASTVTASIYRRHRNVRELVIATLERELLGIATEVADHGSLRADLIAFVSAIGAALTPERARILAGLLLPMRRDAALSSMLTRTMEAMGLVGWNAVIQRAIVRRELTREAQHLGTLGVVAPALVLNSLLILQSPVTDTFVRDVVDNVLLAALMGRPAMRPAARRRSRPPGDPS
jgi:AcrR family transcriptional regulator